MSMGHIFFLKVAPISVTTYTLNSIKNSKKKAIVKIIKIPN